MRINRQKKVSRILRFYCNNFGFRKPYQVLVDGTFCNTALQNKINITEQLLKYLGGDVKLLTTPCAILEMEKLGSPLYGATLILKQFPVHQCGHKSPIFAAACIKNMIGKNNEFRYILASQDRDLQRCVTHHPGVPLLYIFNKAPMLRPPNELSVKRANQHLNQSSGDWLACFFRTIQLSDP
nr:rRNA-processing protein UTP23 homolog isoform X2 [Halyomorpha halys]